MSQLFETSLEEYARQCTIQRRRYEECLQQAQQSCVVNVSPTVTKTIVQDTAAAPVKENQVDPCFGHAVQSCMIELLEIPSDPLGWDDEIPVSNSAKNGFSREQKWYGERARTSHPAMGNSTAKSPSPVGFGAP